MSKFPLAWHKQGLENAVRHLAETQANLTAYVARIMDQINRSEQRIALTTAQIAEAEARGLDGFDPDRFLVKAGAEMSTTTARDIALIKAREYECFMEDHEPKPWTPRRCAGYAGRGSLGLHLFRCKRRDGYGLGGLFCKQHAKDNP